MRASRNVPWLILATLAMGCSGQDTLDIGDRDVSTLGSALSDYAARWVGYAEAFEFADGSDRMVLTLDENGEGRLQVGNTPLWDPPVNPDVGYPEGMDWGEGAGGLQPGFEYLVQGATLESRRIRIGVNPMEFHEQWCQIQSPVLDEFNAVNPPLYSCAPVGNSVREGENCIVEGQIQIDCGKLALCNHLEVCVCTASECVASERGTVSFDGALEQAGAELVGTLLHRGRLTVRLSRDVE